MENSSSRAEERTALIPLTPSITGSYIQGVYDFLTRPATVSEDEPISWGRALLPAENSSRLPKLIIFNLSRWSQVNAYPSTRGPIFSFSSVFQLRFSFKALSAASSRAFRLVF